MFTSPDQVLFTFILTTFATFAITFIEVQSLSDASVKHILFNFRYWTYFFLQLFGNVVAAALAAGLLKDKLSGDFATMSFALYSFFGIAGFWGVLSRSNININTEQSFNEWIQKIKLMAGEAAKKNLALAKTKEKVDLLEALMLCEEKNIEFHLNGSLDQKQKAELKKELKDNPENEKRVKCLKLVNTDKDMAKVLVQKNKKELATTKKSIFDLIKK